MASEWAGPGPRPDMDMRLVELLTLLSTVTMALHRLILMRVHCDILHNWSWKPNDLDVCVGKEPGSSDDPDTGAFVQWE